MARDPRSVIAAPTVLALALATALACVRVQPAIVPVVPEPVPAQDGPRLPASETVPETPVIEVVLVVPVVPVAPVAPVPAVVVPSATDSVDPAPAKQGDSLFSFATADTVLTGPVWDINVHSYEWTPRVQYYVGLYSGAAKDRITERLERGSRFEPMIRQQMRDGGIPEDMYYMALIESGFDPGASSSAAAVGMWQFMASTAREMGLRVDTWVDERRDPIRSTNAAVRFIRSLRDEFGSLYLAAAAYDGGPVRIEHGLSRYKDAFKGTTGDDLFFALADKSYLRGETKEYVPQLIAAALIAKDPSRYGMAIHNRTPFAYDSVQVGPLTPLTAVAKASGASLADIRELNLYFVRGMTPPHDTVQVRVPLGSATGFDSAFAALPSEERVGRVATSKKGETPSSKPAAVATKSAVASHPKPATDPAAEKSVAPHASPTPATNRPKTHVVVEGETLGLIAKHAGVSVTALMKANDLHGELIHPRQVLVIPKG